jgi:hypothetical protein
VTSNQRAAIHLGYALGLFQIVVGIHGLIAFGWSVIGILRPRELPQMMPFHRLPGGQPRGATLPGVT